jgi:hypothetical protein
MGEIILTREKTKKNKPKKTGKRQISTLLGTGIGNRTKSTRKTTNWIGHKTSIVES